MLWLRAHGGAATLAGAQSVLLSLGAKVRSPLLHVLDSSGWLASPWHCGWELGGAANLISIQSVLLSLGAKLCAHGLALAG